MLKFHNTLTKNKEEFKPIDANNVRMYVCGPTVYDYIHIGNARPIVVFDSIYKLLKHYYKNVTFVRNITDVDDKIIARAKENNETIGSLTQRTTEYFIADTKYLGCVSPTHEPKATDHIEGMLNIIQLLMERGFAYEGKVEDGYSRGDILFDVNKFAKYGELSGLKQEDIIAGARIEVDELKRNPSDFVLWKPAKENEQAWSSPFGYGRPGWHIECSAMSKAFLGESFDIHGGGKDLIFPHHENEIAQSTCAFDTHNHMANYWLHNGFVMVEGQKMSKSLGNFITVKDLAAKYNGEVIRLTLLATHYRQPLDFKEASLAQSKTILHNFYKTLENTKGLGYDSAAECLEIMECLQDDFNTPKAITVLHKKFAMLESSPSTKLRSEILNAGYFLGILQQDPATWLGFGVKISEEDILMFIEKRNVAKANKDYKLADAIRAELLEHGVVLEDSKDGVIWKAK